MAYNLSLQNKKYRVVWRLLELVLQLYTFYLFDINRISILIIILTTISLLSYGILEIFLKSDKLTLVRLCLIILVIHVYGLIIFVNFHSSYVADIIGGIIICIDIAIILSDIHKYKPIKFCELVYLINLVINFILSFYFTFFDHWIFDIPLLVFIIYIIARKIKKLIFVTTYLMCLGVYFCFLFTSHIFIHIIHGPLYMLIINIVLYLASILILSSRIDVSQNDITKQKNLFEI